MIALRRVWDTGQSTLGVLYKEGYAVCFTLEDTGIRHDAETYRIPPGVYKLKRVHSPKFGEVFEVLGVDGHSLLRIHWGNTSEDTKGCPLVGMMADAKDGGRVLESKIAFDKFMSWMVGINETEIAFY